MLQQKEKKKILSKQWSSHFFKSGTVKSRLKGYRHGKSGI